MSEEVKSGTVFFSLGVGVFLGFLGIISIFQIMEIQERCEYLEKQIEQQTMLIEYLKGGNNG